MAQNFEKNKEKNWIFGMNSKDNFSNESTPTIMITTDQVYFKYIIF